MIKNILITGVPRVGKTTMVKRLVEALSNYRPVGFFTNEIVEKDRVGFELVSLEGQRKILSHVNIRSRFRVGRYFVDVDGFEDFLRSIDFGDSPLVVIDEIAKMECFSETFINLISALLDSDRIVLATVALQGKGFLKEVKERDDVKIFRMDLANRDKIFTDILSDLRHLIQKRLS
ncbi:MAG: nucleoside-triphosphatase [Thermodesulfovibrionales bacterium]